VLPSRKPRQKPKASPPAIDIAREKVRLARLLPDIDPGDLDLILRSLARPFGSGRRFFLREIRPGVRVF
jgi:hypothetical protein